LLTPAEQQLFRRLAVFTGGSTPDAATAVADADVNSLQSLVDKNLLRHEHDRYQMLETIREYAGERLEESGEADELRGCLVDWLLERLTTARATIQEAETIAELDADLANIRGAVEWLQVTCRGSELMKLARYVWIYLLIRSPNEARSLLEAAVALSPDETEDRARALNGLAACVLNTSGDLAAAEEIARESVEVSRRIGFSERGGLATLGIVATMQGRFAEARELYEQSARISERTGDAEGLRDARIALGDLALNRGDFALAEALSEQALHCWANAASTRSSSSSTSPSRGSRRVTRVERSRCHVKASSSSASSARPWTFVPSSRLSPPLPSLTTRVVLRPSSAPRKPSNRCTEAFPRSSHPSMTRRSRCWNGGRAKSGRAAGSKVRAWNRRMRSRPDSPSARGLPGSARSGKK
jgi:tetratricopeptide (TPR) repeat protein